MSKQVFFASDFHLGIQARLSSKEREKNIVAWMTSIQDRVSELYLVGDIFDYWFEYGSAIPRGFSHFLGKLAEYRSADIPVYFFKGNHDMWMFNYFQDEYDIPVYRDPIIKTIQGKKVFIAHGDGLGPGDHGYKFIKKVFSNKMCQWAYARLHPNFGIRLMQKMSGSSRDDSEEIFHGRDKEMLIQYAEHKLKELSDIDYFVFGHRHLPLQVHLSNNHSMYYGLGDWTNYQSYGVMDQGSFDIQYFQTQDRTIVVS